MKARFLLALLPLVAACAPSVEYSPARGASGVCPDTHLVLTFASEPAVPSAGMLRVFDLASGECVDSLDFSLPAGLTEPRTYSPDCDYTKVPYDYTPRAVVPTNRTCVPGTPSGTAEPTPRDMQLNIIGGFTDGFRFHPVIVHGCAATIYLHNNVLERGHRYEVRIDPEAFGCELKRWRFSVRAEGPADPRRLSVAADGSGDFCTVQGALDFVPEGGTDTTWISIAAGDYEEIIYARSKRFIVLRGAGMDETRVHYANNEVFNPHPLTVKNNEKDGAFPYRRAAFALDHCNDVVVSDMTIATDLKGQAEGLLVNGDRVALYDVRIVGDGDALQANGTVYLEDCELDGGVDAILGRGSVYFQHCHIFNHGGPLSWVRNFKPAHGDVLVDCLIESVGDKPADYGRSHSNHGSVYPEAEFVVIDCKVRNLLPSGWSRLDQPSASMLEYGTLDADTGEPADVSQRHPLSRQLSAVADSALIASYRDPAFILGGWSPARKR